MIPKTPVTRRSFLKGGLAASAALALEGLSPLRVLGKSAAGRKVLVLGIDGLDAGLLKGWMDEGRLPAFRRLAGSGGFRPLATSIPPQSPVAWSNFITGSDPGVHGIFDFIHRDPKTYMPAFSASATSGGGHTVRLGNYIIPLSGGKVENLRRGRAFWQILEERGVPATIFKIPANYPPVATKQRTLAGMGTPDIQGSYGMFNYYTNEPRRLTQESGGGGTVHDVYVIGNRVEAKLPGPVNTFRPDAPKAEVDFQVFIDPTEPVAKVRMGGEEFILREKEWSGWKRVRFGLMPTQGVSGICMFYLKEVRPRFKLYVSPVHIDPANPAMPLSTPESYAKELERRFGPYFTKGLPADTSALDNEVLDEGEFLALDRMVLAESEAMLHDELRRFDAGVLFFYFSNADQRQHMFWRLMDPAHPAYKPELAAEFGGVIRDTYVEMDRVLAGALARAGRDVEVLVMSDHGFNPYRRGFNLNTWLWKNGYHARTESAADSSFFQETDWSRSRAYGVGLNGLYVNERGREREGIVAPGAEKEALVREIAARLEAEVDPKTGEKVMLRAYVSKDVYHGPAAAGAPDIVLGFNRGYRITSQSPLGTFPAEVLEDNVQKWSGDHMTSPDVIPGVLLASRPIAAPAPALYDVTASVLDLCGVETPPDMRGRSAFRPSGTAGR